MFVLLSDGLASCTRTLMADERCFNSFDVPRHRVKEGKDGLVKFLGLNICVRVVRCSRYLFDSKEGAHFYKEPTYELGALVGQQVRYYAV